MESLMDDVAAMLGDALGIDGAAEWGGEALSAIVAKLPMVTRSLFDFSGVEMLGERMVVARPLGPMKPAALVGQMEVVSECAGMAAVCFVEDMTPYLRKTLLGAGAAFVSADGQAFVPGLLRLTANRELAPKPRRSSLSPAAKLAFLYLVGHVNEDVTVADLVSATGLSRSSGKRALEEVRAEAPLARRIGGPTSRTAIYRVDEPGDFSAQGSAAFGEAIESRFFVGREDAAGLPLSGLSALAARSLLSPPEIPQVACSPSDSARLRLGAVNPEPGKDVAEVQALSYDPAAFVEQGLVDLCTMAMTVDRSDERVDSAVEEAVGGSPWLMSVR